jgi:hypothetical protein
MCLKTQSSGETGEIHKLISSAKEIKAKENFPYQASLAQVPQK